MVLIFPKAKPWFKGVRARPVGGAGAHAPETSSPRATRGFTAVSYTHLYGHDANDRIGLLYENGWIRYSRPQETVSMLPDKALSDFPFGQAVILTDVQDVGHVMPDFRLAFLGEDVNLRHAVGIRCV